MEQVLEHAEEKAPSFVVFCDNESATYAASSAAPANGPFPLDEICTSPNVLGRGKRYGKTGSGGFAGSVARGACNRRSSYGRRPL